MIDENISNAIVYASHQLSRFAIDASARSLESVRLGRVIYALNHSGYDYCSSITNSISGRLLERQLPDGGWTDPEETAWAASGLRILAKGSSKPYQLACQWLKDNRLTTGGWGKHNRDQPRITLTGLISALLPEVISLEDLTWLEAEWQKDFDGSVRLSYKAGYFLLAMSGKPASRLIQDSLKHLMGDQNDDGGFAPWKGHPIGSDPWSTGVVLWGLSRWPRKVKREVFERALQWLASSQLPSGYWPYHYLDDGTSLALIGAVSAIKCLAKCAP